jgi:hypothetical protein
MVRVNVLVEGQTEEAFVTRLLAPHFALRHIYLTPILLTTKRVKHRSRQERAQSGRLFKGGVTSYANVKRDALLLLRDQEAIVTSMIDFYGLPTDFPGMDTLPRGDGYAQVQHLEAAFTADINRRRFHPFLMLHEYEALLFTQPADIAAVFPEQEQALVEPFGQIRAQFQSPEEINQGQDTHPAARILAHVAGYRKPLHGVLIAERIGLTQLRQTCAHFAAWVTWLESLAD